MLALQVVAGALLLAGSLALVAFLRWLESQEPQGEVGQAVALPRVARVPPSSARRQTLKRAA